MTLSMPGMIWRLAILTSLLTIVGLQPALAAGAIYDAGHASYSVQIPLDTSQPGHLRATSDAEQQSSGMTPCYASDCGHCPQCDTGALLTAGVAGGTLLPVYERNARVFYHSRNSSPPVQPPR